jgi:hypothetical protein
MNASDRIPTPIEDALVMHRRGFLKSAGLLAVSFGVFGGGAIAEAVSQSNGAADGTGPYHDPDFHQIDSWIVIHEDNTATFYVGKTDPGQGTGTCFRQLMSDELDIAFAKTSYYGQYGHYGRSGRFGRFDSHGKRFVADAPRGCRSAARAARNGLGTPGSARRSISRQRRPYYG